MKALVYEGVETLGFRDMADPVANEGEHLIKVEAVGICGSDMHAYLGHDDRRPAPLILGHEAAGTVVEGPWVGRRVTINPLVSNPNSSYSKAGRENLCPERQIISMPPRQGAFAQYVAMPGHNLVEVPDNFPLAKAALAEPLAVSWHAAALGLKALHPSMERRALVIGGGAIGLAAALALKAMGVDEVILSEPNEARRNFLEHTCGQKAVARPEGRCPLVIDAVGFGVTRAAASAHVSPGGVIAHVGLGDSKEGFDIRFATLQEVTLIGTYTYTAQDFRDTAQAMFDGRLGPLDWTEARPLSAGAQAFADLHAGRVAVPKIVLDPWNT
ncbi:MAG: alcohol dehydrogenase catalytic domain-containing protein [Pseudomonadota bacterium]